ncbi:MAG: helix-turn-helix domain-containing protein [Terracidiphilus sp.]
MRKNVRRRFGDRIKSLRVERHWSQEDLAERSGIGRVFISQMENGHKEACLAIIETLADSFSITISELMEGV